MSGEEGEEREREDILRVQSGVSGMFADRPRDLSEGFISTRRAYFRFRNKFFQTDHSRRCRRFRWQ